MALLCLATMSTGCGGCTDDDRTTLLDIRGHIFYVPPEVDWSSRDCCEWDGVTCSSRTGRVTGLDLSIIRNVALGRINATMFLPLQELRNLSLSHLQIEGCTPDAGFEVWSNLRNLKILDLSGSTGSLESSILSLTKILSLRSLFLNGNHFTSNVTIQQLSIMKLHTLDISNNDIQGSLPTDICNMRGLQVLYLGGNVLSGELPPCMQNLTSLRVIELSNNNGLIVKFPSLIFENLTSLVKLSLLSISLEGVLSLNSLRSHSQLTHLELGSTGSQFQVQTENPATHMSAQLQVLVLPNCKLNGNSSLIPSFLFHQHALKSVDMSNNNLSGYFPLFLIENNVNLSRLVLRGNLFSGPFLPSKVHTNLLWLDASYNRLNKLPVDINNTLPNLEYLALSRNYFQGIFPSAFSYLDSLQFLDLSYNNFSDNIGAAFFGSMSNITALKLSGNHFYGSFPRDIVLPSILHLLVDDNEITGEFSQMICGSRFLMTFDASNNKLTGTLPTCISSFTELCILNLRGNSLVGSISSDVCNLKVLTLLDVSRNNLSGPVHCLPDVYYLHMSENQFNGTFPIPLSASNIYTMDLRENQFSGCLPKLIMDSFPKLKVLLLKHNTFEGAVPYGICKLKHLRLLDLSHNKLSGQLPSCLHVMGSDDTLFDFHPDFGDFPILFNVIGLPIQEEFMTKNREDYYKGNILNYVTGLDFSSNHLKGSIHESIGSMKWLRALNFSDNYLDGSIPQSLSNLSDLESLDLSHNNLEGHIPSELVALQALEVFSVAHNNLSGPTPGTMGQFLTFDQSSYEGNPNLCGPPLLKSCFVASVPELEERGADDDRVGDIILFGCSAMFYMVGFWTSLGVLYFKTSWRWSWFSAVDKFSNFVIVKLAIYTRKNRSTN
ncbi:receptor-like protein 15 [Hordeum vulgare subsp. vulgare]|uniref:receptor-like protein 15 n=1 Tax=Hordeum vulgare subsp. vulgare TaxID=112509 RepID=UPI001D1A5641|nr:receptor-like protein 15 [Hordeum vulgare subsp. vulgare]